MNNPVWSIYQGDVLDRLRDLPPDSVQCVVTSPPYWGLRCYGCDEQIGREKTLEEYVAKMVEVFAAVRRVLRPDGTVWLNLGDSYSSGNRATYRSGKSDNKGHRVQDGMSRPEMPSGLKPKDLIGLPWRVAFALQSDGWYLRSDVIWSKPNPMPEPVADRPTKSHEHVFLLSKSARYFYDAEAVRQNVGGPAWNSARSSLERPGPKTKACIEQQGVRTRGGDAHHPDVDRTGHNLYDVWVIPTQPFPEAHFATFPERLVEPCIKAGTSEKGCCSECGAAWLRETERWQVATRPGRSSKARGMSRETAGRRDIGRHVTVVTSTGWQPACKCVVCGEGGENHGQPPAAVPCTVLDPFVGASTTMIVALRLGREAIGIELNADYCKMAEKRIRKQQQAAGGTAR